MAKAREDYWLQVQLLKHTVLQVYDKLDWNMSIRKVHKKARGFKVGIAFEFRKHVVAFLTQDLLLQMHWAQNRGELPAQQPDQRRDEKVNRSGNAMEKLRTEGVMCGVGVYTVSELWHRAGLSPSLTEAEVFDSASRTARLCAAYYSFVYDAVADNSLWTLVKRHRENYTIAVHTEDRTKYAESLYVWGKDRCSFTARFNNLLKQFKMLVQSAANYPNSLVRRADDPAIPFDVFEPELCRAALLLLDDRNLGLLIFGESEWVRLATAAGLPPPCHAPDNALTCYFAKPEFKATSKTWLDPSAYDFLLLDTPSRSELCSNWTKTILYRVNNANVWSVIPIYENSIPDTLQYPEYIPVTATKKKTAPTKPLLVKITVESGEERKKLLISFVTQHTKNYTIGPLDYCGIARRVKTSGKDIIMLCEEDPRVLAFFRERRGYERETARLKGAGTEKEGLPKNIVTKLKKGRVSKRPLDKENIDNTIAPKKKKPRRSADSDLVQASSISPSRPRALRSRPPAKARLASPPLRSSSPLYPASSLPALSSPSVLHSSSPPPPSPLLRPLLALLSTPGFALSSPSSFKSFPSLSSSDLIALPFDFLKGEDIDIEI
ncbi:hypothetical protein LshimejAT787_1500460 [Lyophyllum shimeji]|uniref:Uncharacterized protein n=1 Tax=Lyophyllum shimeji TaxID=47721 RepID=A0A9P3PZ30_LYOSH|nr:hypothetical protein LshimejAT787_1500460 [Lyophyllum shimeji]